MSSRLPADVHHVRGRSSFDIVLPAPTVEERELVEILFHYKLIQGETYMGDRWPVYLISWTRTDLREVIVTPLVERGDDLG